MVKILLVVLLLATSPVLAMELDVDGNGAMDIARGGTDATTASGARINLGLGTTATTDSTAYATSAQGAKADTATQPGDFASPGPFGGTTPDTVAGTDITADSFISSAADGEHYIIIHNDGAFTPTPVIGMLRSSATGVYWYNGTNWINVTTGNIE